MVLSRFERMVLAELLEVKMAVRPDEDYKMIIDALRSGYSDYYNIDFYGDELPEGQTIFVHDVFEMYERMQFAFRTAGEELPREALCPGFDGNNQPRLHGFARFLIENDHSHGVLGGRDFPNSHGFQPEYERMLRRYKTLMTGRSPYQLTIEEARELLVDR